MSCAPAPPCAAAGRTPATCQLASLAPLFSSIQLRIGNASELATTER